MAASPATISETQNGPVETRPKSTVRATAEPARLRSDATDDEILGLSTNVRRRDLRGPQAPAKAAREAHGLERLQSDSAGENGGRNGLSASDSSSSVSGPQNEAQNGDVKIGSDPGSAVPDATDAAGAAEPVHLRAAFEENPELRAAWHDANTYRKTFATPEEALAATGMLADLNRMDTLFFSRRPEDPAQLARARPQVAQTAGATFPAIAARSTSADHSTASHSAPVDASASARFATTFSPSAQVAQ